MRQADKRFAYRSSCIYVLGSGAHAELLMEHLENESIDDDAGKVFRQRYQGKNMWHKIIIKIKFTKLQ